MRLRLLLLPLAWLLLSACNEDRFDGLEGCVDDSACASGRVCMDGVCVDGVRVDAGPGDTSGDVRPTDATPDSPTDTAPDSPPGDTRPDAPPSDASPDARPDIGPTDTTPDVPPTDAAPDVIPTDTAPDVPPTPCVFVEPEAIDFDVVRPLERATRVLRVRNCGTGTATLSSIILPPEVRAEVTFPRTIPPGERAVIPLVFSAPTERVIETTASLSFARAERVEVPLRAEVRDDVTTPTFCVSAASPVHDFGSVEGSATATLAFVNCGSGTITPRRIAFGASDPGFDAFVVEGAAVNPGERFNVRASFTPIESGEASARYQITFLGGDTAGTFELRANGVVVADGPILQMRPASVGFGPVDSGEFFSLPGNACNIGDETLEIFGFDLFGDDVFQVGLSGADRLAPGMCTPVQYIFQSPELPEGESQRFTGTLEVRSNATSGDSSVPLQGTAIGREGSDHCLRAVPPEVSLTLRPGQFSETQLEFVNCGTSPVRVIEYQVDGLDPLPHEWGTPIDPDELIPPGGTFTLFLSIAGEVPGEFAGIATVWTERTRAEALVRVRVEDDDVCPSIRPGASTSIRGPFTSRAEVTVGQEFYIDSGHPEPDRVATEWAVLEFPAEPPVLAETPFPGRVRVSTERVGAYLFEVRTFSAAGCETAGLVEVEVVRDDTVGEGLRFVVTWRTPGDPDEFNDPGTDIDMHVVRGSDRSPWQSERDCYYGNRSPDWGCRLLRDELNGIGPEITVIEDPDPAESYFVGVHYYSDKGFGESEVTLRVFRDGIQIAAATRVLERSDRFWLAAEVLGGGADVVLPDDGNINGFPP